MDKQAALQAFLAGYMGKEAFLNDKVMRLADRLMDTARAKRRLGRIIMEPAGDIHRAQKELSKLTRSTNQITDVQRFIKNRPPVAPNPFFKRKPAAPSPNPSTTAAAEVKLSKPPQTAQTAAATGAAQATQPHNLQRKILDWLLGTRRGAQKISVPRAQRLAPGADAAVDTNVKNALPQLKLTNPDDVQGSGLGALLAKILGYTGLSAGSGVGGLAVGTNVALNSAAAQNSLNTQQLMSILRQP